MMITLRASDDRLKSYGTLIARTIPTGTTQLARTYDKTYDVAYIYAVNASGSVTTPADFLTATNRGDTEASPLIQVYGLLSDALIKNETTGQTILLNGDIVTGDVITLDEEARTIIDSSGNTRFSMYDPSSTWITLQPGDNIISLTVSDFDSSGLMVITWKHSIK